MNILLAFDKETSNTIDIQKTLSFLNSKCSYFKFHLAETTVEFEIEILTKPNSFDDANNQLNEPIGKYDRVFVFTEFPYDDNYFFHEHNLVSIYSFFGWSYLTNLPQSNGMLYFIIDYLALRIDKSGFRHQEETGCIYDFLWSKGGIDDGMRQAKICSNCLERVNNQISSEEDSKIINDLKILMNELSNSSKWNQDILKTVSKKTRSTIPKRKPKVDNEIHVVIASPGDTGSIRQILIDRLEIQFRKGNHEAHCKKRLIVHGWEDLASQNGYAQDVINEKIISEMDIVLSVFKHKLGTPTVDQETGEKRALSGTAEELMQALDYSKTSHPIGMTYFYSKAPVISLDSPDKNRIEKEWQRLKEFKKSISSKLIYKPYTDENELLQITLKDLEKNIIDYYE